MEEPCKGAKWKKPGTKKKNTTYDVIPFTWKVHNGQINKDRKIGDLLGPGGIRQLESMGLLLEMMKMF